MTGFESLNGAGAGIVMLAIGIGLLGLEIFVTSFGLLTVGGLLSLVAGSIMLAPQTDPLIKTLISISWGIGLVLVAYIILAAVVALRMRKRPAASGVESLVGAKGVVKALTPEGALIHVAGEDWLATESGKLKVGQKVKVLAIQGLKVIVE